MLCYFFDSKRPINFRNGNIVAKKDNLIHYASIKKVFDFDEPGYMDEIKNNYDSKSLMVEIAMQMAMSDGSLDKSEGNVIKRWIKKEVESASDSKKDELKENLNSSLESSYKKLSSGESIDSTITKFSEIASQNIKYQLIDLCLDVLSADGLLMKQNLKS